MAYHSAVIKRIAQSISVPEDFRKSRAKVWMEALGLKGDEDLLEVLRRAVRGAVGQFNFWEGENQTVTWAYSSEGWFAVTRGEKDISSLNLVPKRTDLLGAVDAFFKLTPCLTIDTIKDPLFWAVLTHLFGGDPLRKRETLLWIMLDDLSYEYPKMPDISRLLPSKGCIDYNIMLYLRYMKAVTGYSGRIFDLYTETKLRMDCLRAVDTIMCLRPDLTVSSLDSFLWESGRRIRHTTPREEWDPLFCYRFGCYFY